MHTEGEIAGAHAAARAGIPFSLSTLGTTSIEDVKAANPHGRNWFQLYMWKDRDRSMALVSAPPLLATLVSPRAAVTWLAPGRSTNSFS